MVQSVSSAVCPLMCIDNILSGSWEIIGKKIRKNYSKVKQNDISCAIKIIYDCSGCLHYAINPL